MSTLFSAAILRTKSSPLVRKIAAENNVDISQIQGSGTGFGGGAGAAGGLGSGCASALGAGAAASSPPAMRATTEFTATVWPSFTSTSESVPAAGEGISA